MEKNVGDILKAADRAGSGRSVKGFSGHQSGFFLIRWKFEEW